MRCLSTKNRVIDWSFVNCPIEIYRVPYERDEDLQHGITGDKMSKNLLTDV